MAAHYSHFDTEEEQNDTGVICHPPKNGKRSMNIAAGKTSTLFTKNN